MISEFKQRHSRLPEKIVATPDALLLLGIKGSVAPVWQGIPVESRWIKDIEVLASTRTGTTLGVFVKARQDQTLLAACDLD